MPNYLVCFPSATCSALAFTNFETFDGTQYEAYPEECGYILLRDCSSISSQFKVEVQNEDCVQNEHSQNCKKQNLIVTISGRVVEIKRTISSMNVDINVVVYGQPLIGHEYGDEIIQLELIGGSTGSLVMSTEFFELISSGQNFYLTANEDLMEKTCGLCGKYNKDSSDDFSDPQGGPLESADNFLRSWAVGSCASGSITLGEVEPTLSKDYCTIYSKNKGASETRANHIMDPNGPFSACLAKKQVDPYPFFTRAMKTACRNQDSLCDVAAGFAKACGDKGIPVPHWRTVLGCTPSEYIFTNFSEEKFQRGSMVL